MGPSRCGFGLMFNTRIMPRRCDTACDRRHSRNATFGSSFNAPARSLLFARFSSRWAASYSRFFANIFSRCAPSYARFFASISSRLFAYHSRFFARCAVHDLQLDTRAFAQVSAHGGSHTIRASSQDAPRAACGSRCFARLSRHCLPIFRHGAIWLGPRCPHHLPGVLAPKIARPLHGATPSPDRPQSS
jgi:hypothetical protein